MTTGDRIRQARINNRLTQDKLATLLRVSRVTISSWENGQNTPTVENIAMPPTARAEVINYLRYQTWLHETNK